MTHLKTLHLLLRFYQSFFLAAFTITLACAFLLEQIGLSALSLLVWFKLITLGIIVLYINSYKAKEFFYYQNLGISKLKLWCCTLVPDFLLFILVLILTGIFR